MLNLNIFKCRGPVILLLLSGLLFIIALLIFEFVCVGKYAQYPWWHHHYEVNDTDAVHAGQTMVMLNGRELRVLAHPAATIYTLNGLVYRVLGIFSSHYRSLLSLANIHSLQDASDVLDVLTNVSRVTNFILALVFALVFYLLLYRVSAHPGMTFLFGFYVLLSPAFLRHTPVVRPEIPSLLFLLLALLLALRLTKTRRLPASLVTWLAGFIGMGLLMGFSVFSKVQTLPLNAILAAFFMIFLILHARAYEALKPQSRRTLILIGVAVANFVIMPWWALARPAFLTPGYQKDITLRLIYGPCPDSFKFPVLIVLMLLLLIAGALFVLERMQLSGSRAATALFPAASFLNLSLSGFILAIYSLLLPVSGTFRSYLDNTHTLVYAFLTNVTYRGFAQNPSFDFFIFARTIWEMHLKDTRLLNIHIVYLTAFTALASGIRLVIRSTKDRPGYLFVLFFLAVGLMMDLLASMRWRNTVQDNYAIYSMSAYVLAMARWTSLEWGIMAASRRQKIGQAIIKWALILLFGANVLWVSRGLLTRPRADGRSTQSPLLEFQNNNYFVPSFWAAARQSQEQK